MVKKYLFGIDPGTTQSGYCLLDIDTHEIIDIGKVDNEILVERLSKHSILSNTTLVIEEIKSYGNIVGDSVLKTCVWTGRFIQAWGAERHIDLIPRKTVVSTICLNPRAKDSNIRAAMINKYGPIGVKSSPGKLYRVKKDMWQALGLCVAWCEIRQLEKDKADSMFN